ncbi:MAG: DUF4932 domain-containing protein [Bacteroidota bacterium]
MRKPVLSLLLLLSLTITCSQPQNYENYHVQIPPAFELANIMVALTDFGKSDDNITKKNTEYHREVITHFEPFTDHKAIKKLNKLFSRTRNQNYYAYSNFRTGSYEAYFDEDQLKFNTILSYSSHFKRLKEQIEDFARETDFPKFYTKHKPLYEHYITQYKRYIPVSDMWSWMESEFPNRYQGYKIIMSPLIAGFHNTIDFENTTMMFVNVPRNFVTGKSVDKTYEALMVRVVLTEIDHNYVNPVSKKWSAKISDTLADLSCWNQSQGGYNSAQLTFNEYMTWAVFSLYLREKYDNEVFEKVNENQARFMVERRGFVQFTDFNDYLLALYAQKQPHQKIPDLYPQAIKWFSEQDCK